MAGLTDISIRRPVAITMFYLILMTIGVVGFLYLPVDLLPRIEFPRLSVTVDYANVGPEAMETIITNPLENALSGIPNLERMTSRSEEGRSRVSLEFGRGTNIDEAANDVRAALDRLRRDLPIEADAPSIWKFDPDNQQIVVMSVMDRIRTALSGMALPAEFSIVFGGAYEEQQQARRDFFIAVIMALALVYMVIAGQFERFLDPLIVMFSVPAALVGVVFTLLVTGTTVNVQSVMGMVMLIGIVVNNAILLVDYVNQKRRDEHMAPIDAALAAGRARLRPILMTTATTILGLLPLALGIGEGSGLQAALARVVVGGLIASTGVTLFLIPALYVSATAWADKARDVLAQRTSALRPARG